MVVGVESQDLLVGRIGRSGLDSSNERVIEESLSNVGSKVVLTYGTVGVDGGVGVDQDVDVGSTSGVVTGEDAVELSNTVFVGKLDAAQPGSVKTSLGSLDAGVNSSGIAVPDLNIDIGHGVASVNIDHLVIKGDRNTGLVLDDILADVLASNICEWISKSSSYSE